MADTQTPMPDDFVAAFQIDGQPIRGRVVRASSALHQVLSAHDYPEPVARLLGEALMIGALVARTLKFDGRLLVQTQGEGPVSMLIADCNTEGDMRGYARYNEDKLAALLKNDPRPGADHLIGKGTFAMTIDQGPDMDRYQGLAAIDGPSLATSAEHYFYQSEQIPTRLHLAIGQLFEGDGEPHWRGGGMILQRVAADDSRGQTDDAWDTAKSLFETLSDEELVDPDLASGQLLYRLFHEDGVRMEPREAIRAKCSCSRDRLANTLASFDKEAVADMLEEGEIKAKCEFCSSEYVFSADELGL